jgi:hypothetical protein
MRLKAGAVFYKVSQGDRRDLYWINTGSTKERPIYERLPGLRNRPDRARGQRVLSRTVQARDNVGRQPPPR